jgi:hypothetical protein
MSLALLLQAGGDSSQTLRLLDLPAPWVVVLVVLPLFALVAWIGYGRESIAPRARVVLSSLRVLAFGLLFLVLSRPVHVERREEVHPAEVALLVDDSASMQRREGYGQDAELGRAVEAAVGRASDVSRLELAQGILERNLLPLLLRAGYAPRLMRFAGDVSPLADPTALSGRGGSTEIGSAVAEILSQARGTNLTDIVVLSDGRSNGGLDLAEAARSASAFGVPVHTVLIGNAEDETNAAVELVESPPEALEGDEIALTVRVLSRGTHPASTPVLLEEIDPTGGAPRTLGEETAALTAEGERVVLVAPEASAVGPESVRRFRVSVPPLEGESVTDDNRIEVEVEISPAKIRVLYVDAYPRWEYRYLKNLLLRADQRLTVQCYLLSATADFPQEASPGLASLREIPTTREALLSQYDVIILGDVNPHAVSSSPARVEEFLSSLVEFVEAGGGLLMQAGEWSNPRAFLDTPLEDLLPVVVDAAEEAGPGGDASREFRPMLEDPAHPHEILRLHADPEVNRRLWEDDVEGLRGFYWYYPVTKAKPGAQTLLLHPLDASPRTRERYPLLVLGYYPAGRTMFLAVDSTWMWRFHYGDRYHERFWRNAIRWLALGRLRSGDRRFRLETSRSSYDLEERVQFEARVLDEDFHPSETPTLGIEWSGPDGTPHSLELRRTPDHAGVYRGALQVDLPGSYRAWIPHEAKRVSSAEFEVVLPSRESAEPLPDAASLLDLATRSGGRAVTVASLSELAREFPGGEERRQPISSRMEDAWDRWLTLLVALGLLSAEWVLRKRHELV